MYTMRNIIFVFIYVQDELIRVVQNYLQGRFGAPGTPGRHGNYVS